MMRRRTAFAYSGFILRACYAAIALTIIHQALTKNKQTNETNLMIKNANALLYT